MAKTRPIFVPGTNKVYPSVAAAAKDLGINASGISKVLSGKRPHAGGIRFGYQSDRVIYVPETGQTFSNTVQASRKLGVKNRKLESILQSGTDRTVGGYHVRYESSAALSRPSAQAQAVTAPKAKGKKANKQAIIEQKRQKKAKKYQQQQQREQQRRKERAESAAIQKQKAQERQERRQKRYVDYVIKNDINDLKKYLETINAQLQKYYDEYLMGYSQPAQAVLAFAQYLGEYEDKDTGFTFFDVSDENLEDIFDNMTGEEIRGWMESIKNAIDGYNGLFWDVKKQKDERDFYALEFLVEYPGQIDEYVDLFPALWDIFKEARHKQGDAYRAGGAWEEVQEAVRGGVSRQALADAIKKLHDYYYNNTGKLDDILSDLNSQYVKYNPSPLGDDDSLPF